MGDDDEQHLVGLYNQDKSRQIPIYRNERRNQTRFINGKYTIYIKERLLVSVIRIPRVVTLNLHGNAPYIRSTASILSSIRLISE